MLMTKGGTTNLNKTPITIDVCLDVCLEFSQTPNADERLLRAYDMLFGIMQPGDNSFDRTITHPIMPHVDSGDLAARPQSHT